MGNCIGGENEEAQSKGSTRQSSTRQAPPHQGSTSRQVSGLRRDIGRQGSQGAGHISAYKPAPKGSAEHRRPSRRSSAELPSIGAEVIVFGLSAGRQGNLNGARGTVVDYDRGLPRVSFAGGKVVEALDASHLLLRSQEVVSWHSDMQEVRWYVSHGDHLVRWTKRPQQHPEVDLVRAVLYRHADHCVMDHRNVGSAVPKQDWKRVVGMLAPAADRCDVGHNLQTREASRIEGWWKVGSGVRALCGSRWLTGSVTKVHPSAGEVDVVLDDTNSITQAIPPGHVRPWIRAECDRDAHVEEVTHESNLNHSPHLDFVEVYDTGRKLGEGGFGEVYEVVHRRTKVKYAAKIIPVSHDTKDEVREVLTTRTTPIAVGTKVQSMAYADLLPHAVSAGGKPTIFDRHRRALFISGFVVYTGPCPFGETGWAGVVLDTPVGTHSGTVNGVRYFNAPPNRGAFVKLAHCRPVRPHVCEVWGGMNHPNICKLIDWRSGRHCYTPQGTHDWKDAEVYGQDSANYMVCVMEHSAGGDLESLIRSPGFSDISIGEQAAAEVMRGILSGLHYLHSRGVMHHDLKISNVLLNHPQSPTAPFRPGIKLCDFGLSKWLDGDVGGGTLLYMAPELLLAWRWRPGAQWSEGWRSVARAFGACHDIAKEPPSYNCKIDVFAAGVICYQLLTRGRRHPFHLDAAWPNLPESEHLLRLAESIVSGPEFPDIYFGRTSPECKSFIRELLSPISHHRPTAARALQHPWIVANSSPVHARNGARPVHHEPSQKYWGESEASTWTGPHKVPPQVHSPIAHDISLLSHFKGLKLRETPQGKGPPKAFPLHASRPIPCISRKTPPASSRKPGVPGGGFPNTPPHVRLGSTHETPRPTAMSPSKGPSAKAPPNRTLAKGPPGQHFSPVR